MTPWILSELDQAAEDWDNQPEWMKPLTSAPYLASRQLGSPPTLTGLLHAGAVTSGVVRQQSCDRLPFSPLTGRALVEALEEAHSLWRSLGNLYPFECFPLDTMSERLRAHNDAHPDLWAASIACSRLADAIAQRIDA